MKKLFSYLLFSLCLLSFAGMPNANIAKATENTASRTVFVVQSRFIANTSNGVYVYDNSDHCLKLLNPIASQSESYFVGEYVDLCSVGNSIYLLTDSQIVVFDTVLHTTQAIEVNGLQSYHTKINVSMVDEKPVICVYPLDTANNQMVLYGIDNGADYEFYTIEFSQNQFNQTTTISLLDIVTFNGQIYLLKAYGQSITGFPVSDFGSNLVLSTATTLTLSNNTQENTIVSIKNLYTQTTSNIVVSYENKTDIYEFDGSTLTFKSSIIHRYQDEMFSCLDASVNGNVLALLGDNCYYTAIFSDQLTLNFKMSNPICDIVYRTADNFEYYLVSKNTKFITTLDSNQTTVLESGSYVVEIADVTLSDNTSLQGYKYVMYTTYLLSEGEYVGTNIFGYIVTDDDCLDKINQQQQSSTVKVFENSRLYKYPSVVLNAQNEQNSVVKNISANVPVKVLCYINQYKNQYNQTNTSYALVEVNGDVGFIDTKAIVSTDKRVILAIPNAELIADTNVYEYANTSSNILHRLSETTKIKIIESRDSNGFVKIAYNDDDGNYYEGYIKAYNVSADSYTTMQIIGTVLVLLNVVFLVVLFITKRKIAR